MSSNKINPEDIMYQDDNVCIIRPEVKKGILVMTEYEQPSNLESLKKIGLKTGKQLYEEGVEFGRKIYHPFIFFRAPYYYGFDDKGIIDYSSVKTEIECLYEKNKLQETPLFSRIWIRVDPEKTFVFSSEIRAQYRSNYHIDSQEYQDDMNNEVNQSRKTLKQYLYILQLNRQIKNYMKKSEKTTFLSHLYTSRIHCREFQMRENLIKYPFVNDVYYPINRMSEILVAIPHLTPDYFVNVNVNV